jgi:hypothetical protein
MHLCRVLKDSWRQPVFGIALGYGIFASVELILISFVMFNGESQGAVVSLIKSATFNAVTLLWIGYLRREGELVPALSLSPVKGLNLALATASAGGDEDESFMVWVEQAVDRVLSRHTWPAASSKGSQIVGRQPGPEEKN